MKKLFRQIVGALVDALGEYSLFLDRLMLKVDRLAEKLGAYE